MFKYWYGVLKFEIETLMIVRSFREINIMLLLSTIMKVLELCFALDHYNYAWWLSVFVRDLEVAYGDNPELFSQSQKPMLSSRGSPTIISMRTIINALSQQVAISIWLFVIISISYYI